MGLETALGSLLAAFGLSGAAGLNAWLPLLASALLELREHAVERVADGLAVQLEHDAVLLASPLPPVGRIGERARLPPGVGAREHPGRPQPDAVVDRRDHVLCLGERDEARAGVLRGREAEATVAGRERDLARQRGQPVAIAPVDDLLRCPKSRDRLAALADVLELGAHHLGEDPATAMGRQDADDRDAAAADRPARNGQLEGERARAADDAVAVDRRVHPFERQVAREPLRRLVVRRPAAEVLPGGVLGGLGRPPDA